VLSVDWHNVIRVAAIDCADDANTATCREYEVMGYPTLKFFPPLADAKDVGEERKTKDKSVESIRADMMDYVARCKNNASVPGTDSWPRLDPFRSDDTAELWPPSSKAQWAVLIVDSRDSSAAAEALLDATGTSLGLGQAVLRRASAEDAPRRLFLALGGAPGQPGVFAVKRDGLKAEDLNGGSDRVGFASAISAFAQREAHSLSSAADEDLASQNGAADAAVEPHHVVRSESEIRRRRYTVYMADLERGLLYSLAHEVAQHSSIAGDALAALDAYLEVLVRYFPARQSTRRFLVELRTWVSSHDDVVKGVDMSEKVDELKFLLDAFSDLPSGGQWLGCSGSEAKYGGYPCSLWTLWHTMTVSHATVS